MWRFLDGVPPPKKTKTDETDDLDISTYGPEDIDLSEDSDS